MTGLWLVGQGTAAPAGAHGRSPHTAPPTPTQPTPSPPPQASGFITQTSLHFVRNHGAVPRREWASHRVAVTGMVDNPLDLSMEELLALPARSVTVTMACAGNRRKEQNMHKQSQGFNWGAGAASTAVWTGECLWFGVGGGVGAVVARALLTHLPSPHPAHRPGVRLCDVLALAKAKSAADGARFVHFRGPANELPKGDGTYGTSITLAKASDPAQDVLLAYKQNNRWLTPDHGFPVRVILPGHIGGRTVKARKRMEWDGWARAVGAVKAWAGLGALGRPPRPDAIPAHCPPRPPPTPPSTLPRPTVHLTGTYSPDQPISIHPHAHQWLTEIKVADCESDNWYHYHDNRVLPPDAAAAAAERMGERGKGGGRVAGSIPRRRDRGPAGPPPALARPMRPPRALREPARPRAHPPAHMPAQSASTFHTLFHSLQACGTTRTT